MLRNVRVTVGGVSMGSFLSSRLLAGKRASLAKLCQVFASISRFADMILAWPRGTAELCAYWSSTRWQKHWQKRQQWQWWWQQQQEPQHECLGFSECSGQSWCRFMRQPSSVSTRRLGQLTVAKLQSLSLS